MLVLWLPVTDGRVKREAGRHVTPGEASNLSCPRNGKRTRLLVHPTKGLRSCV